MNSIWKKRINTTPLNQLQVIILTKSNSSENTLLETFDSLAFASQSQIRTAKMKHQKREEEIIRYLTFPNKSHSLVSRIKY